MARSVLLLILIGMLLTGCTTATPTSPNAPGSENPESPAPESTPRPIEGKATGPILFIPTEGVDKAALKSLAAHFKKTLQLDVHVLETKPGVQEDFGVPENLDASRNQLRGAAFLEGLGPLTEESVQNPALPRANLAGYKVIIAVTDQDLYNDKRPVRDYLFSVGTETRRGYRLGVISQKRLNPAFYQKKPDAKVAQVRLRKLLMKQIGRLYYGKPGSDDPTNLMYGGINTVEDVDRLKEKF